MSVEIPILNTERLNLVPPSASSWNVYKQFYCDASASKFYGGPLSLADTRARLDRDSDSWRSKGFGVWVIQRKHEQDLVGTCGFWQLDEWPRELTWWLLPSARGKGIATEASFAAIKFAYDQFHWEAVETYMNDENQAARALVIRLGGVLDSRRMFPDGIKRDVFVIPRPSGVT